MKSKKMMAMLLSAVMCTGVFGVNVQADAEDEVTLTFGFWGDDAEAQMKMRLAEAYMEEHPNVKIEYEYCSGADYLTKIQTWFSSDETPDVFGISNDHLIAFEDSELFEDLTPYIEEDNLQGIWVTML